MASLLDAPPDPVGLPPDRQCGRCRDCFPGDATLHPTALAEWWVCASCRLALFGAPTTRASRGST